MKTQNLTLALILLLTFFGCDSNDDHEITNINFKGLATLLKKTPEVIHKTSPGVFDAQNSTDLLRYYDFEGHPTLGNVEIFYKINNGICDQVSLYPLDHSLQTTYNLINLSEKEFGSGFTYYIIYYNNTRGNYFDTYQQLKDFITEKKLTLSNIDYIEAKYKYKGKIFYVGGMVSYDEYVPFADIIIETKSKYNTRTAILPSDCDTPLI